MTDTTSRSATDPFSEADTQRAASPGDQLVVTRSEERLTAGVVTVPVRRAVVRKRIVTVERTITVPVRHEEFFLDYEDLDPAAPFEPAAAGDATPRTLEFTLSEEVPEIRTVVRPVERVRVVVDRVVEQQVYTGRVRRERVEIDGEDIGEPDTAAGRHRG